MLKNFKFAVNTGIKVILKTIHGNSTLVNNAKIGFQWFRIMEGKIIVFPHFGRRHLKSVRKCAIVYYNVGT